MARFKFGRKKKDSEADTSTASSELTGHEDVSRTRSYFRRHSLSSKSVIDASELNSENMEKTLNEGVHQAEELVANGLRDTGHQALVGEPREQATHGFRADPATGTVGNGSMSQKSAIPSGTPSYENGGHVGHVTGDAITDSTDARSPWRRHKLLDSPFPRYRHVSSAISSEKSEIFIMGGLKEGSVFGDTWKLVPRVSHTGSILALDAVKIATASDTSPPARVGHASVLCGNAFIVYGGDTVDTDANGIPDDNIYMFNINNSKYTAPSHIGHKPPGRYGHSLGVVSVSAASSRLYLFGGQLENQVYNDLYSFELTSFKSPNAQWELVEPRNSFKPPPLSNHSMCVYRHKIYVFGGIYNNEKVSHDVWCYDSHTSKWSQTETSGERPPAMNEHSACIVSDNMYVYGGNDFYGTIYQDLFCLNLHTFKWTKLGVQHAKSGPGPRCGHSMTYLPKLNKLLIMGGNKNDYVYGDAANFDTYEEFAGDAVGTMVYELDVGTAHSLMNGSVPKKMAASAAAPSGGAAGVVNRRAASPVSAVPSEDAFTRHRRSFSAGIEDYRTPHGSAEAVETPVKPAHSSVADVSSFPEPEAALLQQSADKFVDVDVSSTTTSMNATRELNEMREKYLERQDSDMFVSDVKNPTSEVSPIVVSDETPVVPVASSFAHPYRDTVDNDAIDDDEAIDAALLSASASHYASSANGDLGPSPEVGLGSVLKVHDGASLSPAIKSRAIPGDSMKTDALEPVFESKQVKPPAISTPSLESPSDSEVKQAIVQLTAELNALKGSAKSQMETATAKILELEKKNHELEKERDWALSSPSEEHTRGVSDEVSKKSQGSLGEGNGAGETVSGLDTNEKESSISQQKLDLIGLANKLSHVERENAQLKTKHAQFEPFMDNQVAELCSLQKVIKAQEDRIAHLTSQVRSESVLRKEVSEWKHKYEELEADFSIYRDLNAELYVTRDEENGLGSADTSRDLETGDSATHTSSSRKGASQISAHLSTLVNLWSARPSQDDTSTAYDSELVKSLQSQIDDLLETSKSQIANSASQVKALESDLGARSASLKAFEDKYRDASQSVTNTSKALDLTQNELASQKLTIEKLLKENNELKMFKKATNVAKKQSVHYTHPALNNGSTSSQVAGGDTTPVDAEDEGFTAAHYNMRLKDLEADLYIMKQDRDSLNDQVSALKKELYLAKS